MERVRVAEHHAPAARGRCRVDELGRGEERSVRAVGHLPEGAIWQGDLAEEAAVPRVQELELVLVEPAEAANRVPSGLQAIECAR